MRRVLPCRQGQLRGVGQERQRAAWRIVGPIRAPRQPSGVAHGESVRNNTKHGATRCGSSRPISRVPRTGASQLSRRRGGAREARGARAAAPTTGRSAGSAIRGEKSGLGPGRSLMDVQVGEARGRARGPAAGGLALVPGRGLCLAHRCRPRARTGLGFRASDGWSVVRGAALPFGLGLIIGGESQHLLKGSKFCDERKIACSKRLYVGCYLFGLVDEW